MKKPRMTPIVMRVSLSPSQKRTNSANKTIKEISTAATLTIPHPISCKIGMVISFPLRA